MKKMEKFRAWFGFRALMAAMVIMLYTAFPASAARTRTAPASQQTITRSMTGAPDDVGWQRTMTNGVKDNFNKIYDVDKVTTNFPVVNKVNVACMGDPQAVIDDHPATAYRVYSYTLEVNPFKLDEDLEMRQLASAAERSESPSICWGRHGASFMSYDNSTANVSMRPKWATLTRRE